MAAYIDRVIKGLFLNKLIANKVFWLNGRSKITKGYLDRKSY